MLSSPVSPSGLGDLLRHWRAVRGKSQLDLACDAATTPRYVSFVETGRAQPSRQMVVRLARALDVPLRERNDLLAAAGFAPLYRLEPLGSPPMARVEHAIKSILAGHDPFPAILMDRAWNILRANDGATQLFGRLFAPEPVPTDANVLRLAIEPAPCAKVFATGPRWPRHSSNGPAGQPSVGCSTTRSRWPEIAADPASKPASKPPAS